MALLMLLGCVWFWGMAVPVNPGSRGLWGLVAWMIHMLCVVRPQQFPPHWAVEGQGSVGGGPAPKGGLVQGYWEMFLSSLTLWRLFHRLFLLSPQYLKSSFLPPLPTHMHQELPPGVQGAPAGLRTRFLSHFTADKTEDMRG